MCALLRRPPDPGAALVVVIALESVGSHADGCAIELRASFTNGANLRTADTSPAVSAARPLRPADLVAFALGASTAFVIALGATFTRAPAELYMAMYGIAALNSGVWLIATRYSESDRRWRQLLGGSLVLWGGGQVVLAVELASGAPTSPGLGDLLSSAAFPVFVAGITRALWSEAFVRPVLRMVIDAMLMTSVAALVIWRLIDRPTSVPGDLVAFRAVALVVVLLIASFGLLVFLRRPELPTALFASGLGVFAFADLVATFRADPNEAVAPWASAAYAIAMPLFATGARMAAPEPNDGDDIRRDSREAAATIVVTGVLASVSIVHLAIARPAPEVVTLVYTSLAIVAFFFRHLVDHAQRHVLFRRLSDQALTDPLTGISNRFAIERLASQRLGNRFDVMVVGLDGMHEFGAAHGQDERDALVVRAAESLVRWFDDESVVVRLESDEFAIVVPSDAALDDRTAVARQVAEQAIARSAPPTPRVRVSVGAAPADAVHADASNGTGPHGGTMSELIIRAQRARHLARATPSSPVRRYDDTLRQHDARERLIDARLVGAIGVGAISAHFQPVVSLATGAVVGAEALARWDDPELGMVRPDEFIPRAEATGSIDELGRCILRQALAAASTVGFVDANLTVSVNVSPAQLRPVPGRLGFAEAVAQELERANVPARHLVVEVTESILVAEHDPAVDELRRLSSMGVRIGVDDFGSGFWALGYFRWLPADVLKIDRSLVHQLHHDERSQAVVAAIVHLARRTGMTTVAEGIEDEATASVAAELGVGFAQGWAFARPVPADRLRDEFDRIGVAHHRLSNAPPRSPSSAV